MKRIAIIVASVVMGLVIMTVLNNTEISRFGYGVELPIGWQEPALQEEIFCTMEARYDEGLPFSTQRLAFTCQTATNSLANLLNLAIGAALGIIVVLGISKITRKK